METLYQRSRIQEESLYYESQKDSGALPIIGVNTFENPHPDEPARPRELMRSDEGEKRAQLDNLRAFQRRHADRAPGRAAPAPGGRAQRRQRVRRADGDGEGGEPRADHAALFEVGGSYRRSM
jgi:methylmalonyl-CoA mutase